MPIPIRQFRSSIRVSLTRIIETNEGQLRRVPNHVLALVVFLCINVLLQGIADVGLKVASYSDVLPRLPWRTDFLFLTAVSVLMGYRTFMGMRHRKFDVTRNSIELGLLVETGLVIGDIVFIQSHITELPFLLTIRLQFIIFTSFNIFILAN